MENKLLLDVVPAETQAETVGLSDIDIRNMCEMELDNAKPASEIQAAQKLALQQYFLLPDGNEEEDRSKVQSSDVRDAVEAALPILMDMFMSAESPVVFTPNGPDDLQQADQETAFCQYVLHTQNDGLLRVYNWWKDALLFKNGYVKVFWDADVEQEREEYQGLTPDEYAQLLNDDQFQPIEAAQTIDGLYDVVGIRSSEAGQVRIVNIPEDRVGVAGGWNEVNCEKAWYAYHWEPRTKSDLVIDGYDPDLVKSLPTIDAGSYDDYINLSRTRNTDFIGRAQSLDWSRDVVAVYEHYIRADRNGDGIAELLKVCVAGSRGGTLLSIEEIDQIPLISCTGYPIPHSHKGMSLAEIMAETQKIKTSIIRQTLDNLYLSNTPGLEIDTTNVKNPEVLAGSRVGMMLFKNNANKATEAITVPFMAAQSLGVLQAVDEMAEKKTGLSAVATGLDAESLANSSIVNGQSFLNQAQLRMKLMTTMLVETGLRPLMMRIRELTMKHMTREEMIELNGNWTPVNPRNWREKRNTKLRIGVGTVQKQERLAALQNISMWQEKVWAAQGGKEGPLLNLTNLYNTLNEFERIAGHQSTDRYFSNPANFQAPPAEPSPVSEALEIEQAKLAVNAQKDAADIELKAREIAIKERELDIKVAELNQKRVDMASRNLMEVSQRVAQTDA